MSTTLSRGNPLTRFEYESIGHAANTTMRRAERAVRNWPDTTYHQIFKESWELITDFTVELVFFCDSPQHVQLFKDWRRYHWDTQHRHVPNLLALGGSSGFQDVLANARQRRVDLGRRLSDVRAAELRDLTSEDSTIQQFQHRCQRPDAMSTHRERVTALQRNAAATRATVLSVSAPNVTASSLAPISVQAFSDILESNNSNASSSQPASLPARPPISVYQPPTVEDAKDEG